MRICVSNNWLSVVEAEIFVAGSVNVYRVTFDFDESWDGFAANAIFEVPGSDPIEMLVSNGACEIPWEVMSEAKKKFRVGIYGKKDGVRRPTLWTEYFAVAPGASNGVAARPAPAPDIYEQLLDSITKTGTAKEYAEQAQASATKSEEFAIAANQGADEAGNASADAASFAQECNDIYRRLEDLGRVVGDAVMHVDEARWHTDDRANYTTVMAETADRNAQYAQKACDAAESFVEVTRNNASASGLSAQEALNHANASKQSAESAATEAARAKAEADRASAIAGGEFAAVPYVDQKALEAEQNANRYTDEQLESFSGGSSVSKTGDTMAGDLKFEENKGVVFQVYDQYAVPAVSYNAVKMYTPPVDDTDSTVFKIDADSHVQRVQLNKPLDMQSKKVTNVALPESDNDAVNKAYADTKAPIDHATASTDFGLGNEREYGHLRLSDDVYSSSRADGGIAATPNAVNQAYNLASAAAGVAGAAREMVDYAITYAGQAESMAQNALDEANEKATTQTFQATIDAFNGWTSVKEPYTGASTVVGYYKDIAVAGILATDNPVVDFVPPAGGSSYNHIAQSKNFQDAWSHVLSIQTADGTIRVFIDERMEVNIPIQLKVVR